MFEGMGDSKRCVYIALHWVYIEQDLNGENEREVCIAALHWTNIGVLIDVMRRVLIINRSEGFKIAIWAVSILFLFLQ